MNMTKFLAQNKITEPYILPLYNKKFKAQYKEIIKHSFLQDHISKFIKKNSNYFQKNVFFVIFNHFYNFFNQDLEKTLRLEVKKTKKEE